MSPPSVSQDQAAAALGARLVGTGLVGTRLATGLGTGLAPDVAPGVAPHAGPRLPRDLPEFHLRWSEFRGPAQALSDRPDITAEERELILWLIRLADRVGPRDLI